MLSRELNQFSETSKCGNEISEYIYSTFLGELQNFNTIMAYVSWYFDEIYPKNFQKNAKTLASYM